MRKITLFVGCLLAVACRNEGSGVTAVTGSSAEVVTQEFEVTIFSREQSPINRLNHWVRDRLESIGIHTKPVEVLATYLKFAPPNAKEIPGAGQLNGSQMCPLFMGDRVIFNVASGRIVGGHLDVTLTRVVRTPNAQKAIESLLAGVLIPDEGGPGLSLTGGSMHQTPSRIQPLERGERFGLTPDGQCRQKRGWLFTGHMMQEDLRGVYKAMVSGFYEPIYGASLAGNMAAVPKLGSRSGGGCTGCYTGCCLNCTFQAFEGARRGAWPVEEDAKSINNGQCARSFADFWSESYEPRMGVKRVWWGHGDERNLIDNPLELPPGSVVVWDVCGSQGPCPGGRGYGDIGIVTSGPLPGSVPRDEGRGGKTPAQAQLHRVPTLIASWYHPTLLKEQARGCRGKIIGVFLPWRFD